MPRSEKTVCKAAEKTGPLAPYGTGKNVLFDAEGRDCKEVF